jgi:putative SOS response-associated peptidase YedK
MCGRAKLATDFSEIRIAFRIPPERPAPNFAPSWNVAPTDSLPIVRYDAKAGERSADMMRWGLVPYTGPRTSRSASRRSTPKPRRSIPNQRSALRSSAAAA